MDCCCNNINTKYTKTDYKTLIWCWAKVFYVAVLKLVPLVPFLLFNYFSFKSSFAPLFWKCYPEVVNVSINADLIKYRTVVTPCDHKREAKTRQHLGQIDQTHTLLARTSRNELPLSSSWYYGCYLIYLSEWWVGIDNSCYFAAGFYSDHRMQQIINHRPTQQT